MSDHESLTAMTLLSSSISNNRTSELVILFQISIPKKDILFNLIAIVTVHLSSENPNKSGSLALAIPVLS